MSGFMLHGLGDCTPERHCGCLDIPAMTAPEPTRPAEHIDAVALDLGRIADCARMGFKATPDLTAALVAEVRRLTESREESERQFQAQVAAHTAAEVRAEAAEADAVTLRARLAAVESLADQWADRKRSDGMSGNAWIGLTLSGVAADLRAALATTGEGE